MDSYDPDTTPIGPDWLNLDEGERIELVSSYHRRTKVRLPNSQLHAVIHVIIENQLALEEEAVVKALTRLQDEGLSRHDALHAIGSVLRPALSRRCTIDQRNRHNRQTTAARARRRRLGRSVLGVVWRVQ